MRTFVVGCDIISRVLKPRFHVELELRSFDTSPEDLRVIQRLRLSGEHVVIVSESEHNEMRRSREQLAADQDRVDRVLNLAARMKSDAPFVSNLFERFVGYMRSIPEQNEASNRAVLHALETDVANYLERQKAASLDPESKAILDEARRAKAQREADEKSLRDDGTRFSLIEVD